MKKTRVHEQHIAVFGESGSGKTVLLSSFYGEMQERPKDSLYHVVADDIGQGNRLFKNYLGMKNSGSLPAANRFSATSYSFSVIPKPKVNAAAKKTGAIDNLRVIWHDYPGEWFENGVSGPVEEQRRLETFNALLSSDVALLLVDSQRLIDNAGEEERYLKSLFKNLTHSLLALKQDLLEDETPRDAFPRIWVLALSKADLLPDMKARTFRELLVEKAADEIDELREVLEGFVSHSDFLAVGEDFVVLSSAKFERRNIEVSERVGLDLMLPLAAVFAMERKLKWAQVKQNGGKVVQIILGGAGFIIAALGGLSTFATRFVKSDKRALRVVGLALAAFGSGLTELAEFGIKKLEESNLDAREKQDSLRATLTGFQLALRKAEDADVLLTSNR